MALPVFNASFFKTRLSYCDFSLRYKIAFSATPEFENSLVAENQGRIKTEKSLYLLPRVLYASVPKPSSVL